MKFEFDVIGLRIKR